jgi:hypothetical protein
MYELFELEIVKSLIMFKWPIIKQKLLIKLLFPILGFLATLCYYTEYLFKDRLNQNDVHPGELFMTNLLLFVFSSYFIKIESYQIYHTGFSYFQNFWNIIDILPPLLQLVNFIFDFSGFLENMSQNGPRREAVSIIMSLTTLLLWIKLLYFFRIFDQTGFLISAIISVIQDMKAFLLILLVALLAFGDSFKVMSLSNPEKTEPKPGEKEEDDP